jgi:hypothetical protein
MVRIRYAELPVGLHVATRSHGHRTVVYLLPGLTPAQRRAALTFARRSARIGQGPRLPTGDLAVALVADRLHTTATAVSAATRRHPMLLLPPLVVVVSTVIVFVLLSFVAVNLSPPGNSPGQPRLGSFLLPASGGAGVTGQSTRPAGVTPDPDTPTSSPARPTSGHAGAGPRVAGQPSPGVQQIPPQLCRKYRQLGACSSS